MSEAFPWLVLFGMVLIFFAVMDVGEKLKRLDKRMMRLIEMQTPPRPFDDMIDCRQRD